MNDTKAINKFKWVLFIVPSILFYLTFFIGPSISSIYYSFTEWDGVVCKFIGLSNYKELLFDPTILTSIKNTIMYTIGIVLLQNLLGLIFALLFQKSNIRNNILRTLIFMPYIFSSLLIGYVWNFILEPNFGALNSILRSMRLDSAIHPWLSDPFMAKTMIIFITVWQCAGYTMVINIAGLKAISTDYYEAASLDGTTPWKRFRYITFPLMAPSFTINIMLSLIGDLQIFNQVYSLTNGGPGYATESVAMTIFRLGFGSGGSRWGYGAAMSIVMFIFMVILTIIAVTYLRRREVDL